LFTSRIDSFPTPERNVSPTSTLGADQQVLVLTPVADTYVSTDTLTHNHPATATLPTDQSPTTHSYLRFELPPLAGVVTQAILRVYTLPPSTLGYEVRQLPKDNQIVTHQAAPPGDEEQQQVRLIIMSRGLKRDKSLE
jgi:hypothetical protein